jgi:hypothetical protein
VSADTPRNPDAVPPPRAGHEQAPEPDRAQPPERAPAQQPADAGRSPHPPQTLNRADYNAARHAQPPIHRQADAPPPAAGPNHDRRTAHAASGQPHETATTGPREAQTLNRAEHNAARHTEPPIRGSDTAAGQSRDQAGGPPAGPAREGATGSRPASSALEASPRYPPNVEREARQVHNPNAEPVITHYHADFKGQRTDLYTDGTRWASGDRDREHATAGRGELPDDSPTGEELVDSAGEKGSLAERLQRDLYEEGDDIRDVLEHGANRTYDIFAPPPTSTYEAHPVGGPYFSAQQHHGMDVGTGATALFALGLAVDRVAVWTMEHVKKHPEGD